MEDKKRKLSSVITIRLNQEDQKKLSRLLELHTNNTSSQVVMSALYKYLDTHDDLERAVNKNREYFQILTEIFAYIDKQEEARTHIRTWRDHVKSKRLF